MTESASAAVPAGFLPVATVPRLTSLSHGGGCGCKIAPGVLANLLKRHMPLPAFPHLMVGPDTADDAAVYRLNDEQALIATTDFFMPIVDDAYDFGRIAATNALSDVYAMGGTPILALALVGMPISVLPHDTIAAVLRGGEDVCAEAGIPIAGGHSIDSVEPIYGLAALGLVHPQHVKRNATAQAGDVLVLGKALGVGVLAAALKQNQLDAAGYAALIATTTQLNRPGIALAALPQVHALTDVTGFGLLGHTLELARGAQLTARLRYAALPWLPGVEAFAQAGIATGASGRNWNAYRTGVTLAPRLPAIAQALLTDPQTSGGLLVACAPEAVPDVLTLFYEQGFAAATVIGEMRAGAAQVEVV
ncbi:selenide, water dikinase SelD [Paraburkholderia hayleyella]|uniref:selenide, water dikinase SelD n=1 Tax=Paraburkholderia hayleyella TaxID=2152889 RepID=UPI00129282E6|nr:selenide, water dikinase SelD [Paraburkholderia hayleyella]